MGIINNLINWVLDPEDPEIEESDRAKKDISEITTNEEYTRDFQKEDNIKDLDAVIILAKPKSFKDVVVISDQLKKGRAVMLNLDDMVPEEKQRLVDFVSGVIMEEDGMIAKVYNNVYVCANKNIVILNDFFKTNNFIKLKSE